MTPTLLMLVAVAVSVAMSFAALYALKLWYDFTRRRSPLADRTIGHVPGQQLVERMQESADSLLFGVLLMFGAVPAMLLAWALARVPPDRLQFDAKAWVYVLGAILMFGMGLRSLLGERRRYVAARDGLLAERVTGMQLNRLIADGCLVLHDLPADGFNIDHVVIAPRGVFAVETKSFRKPRSHGTKSDYQVSFDGAALRFPDFIERDAPAQAERQAQWLARTLRSALAHEVQVTAALALPGWHITNLNDSWRTAAVKVFSPMGDGARFMAQPIERLDLTQRRAIANALAVRYPSIPG